MIIINCGPLDQVSLETHLQNTFGGGNTRDGYSSLGFNMFRTVGSLNIDVPPSSTILADRVHEAIDAWQLKAPDRRNIRIIQLVP